MKLYNTLSRRLEPINETGDPVMIYVCGITPYDTTHLGHAFTYTCTDILIRFLEYQGRNIRYVQNVTDIDDDIIKRAKQVDEDWKALGNRWTAHYIEDMISLNVRAPDVFPRATDVIPQIVQAVESLVEVGAGYVVNGSVYFSIEQFPKYGKLSGLSRPAMLPIANERGNRPDDPNKKDPLDFVLWQAHAPGEPAWESPWGSGRPGWHIECSTMVKAYLGSTIDIHGGGADLCFPHHESEIAQSEAGSTSVDFVRSWMHIGMVYFGGEKMSKSLGNLVMVRDLLEDWSANTLRLYLASHHYRSEWSYDPTELGEISTLAGKLEQATMVEGGGERLRTDPSLLPEFDKALADDLRTPEAIDVLEAMADRIIEAADGGMDVVTLQAELRKAAGVLGLRMDPGSAQEKVAGVWGDHWLRFI
jgi:L-cysteine:1D-myo-inositol 2-amino-2-deoxy-alpha-D-glucopyranoside ligase